MSEAAIQTKVQQHMKAHNFYVVNVISAGKAGVPDIIACDTKGRFWAVEVKKEGGRASKLQHKNIDDLKRNEAVAFIAYGFADYLRQFAKFSTEPSSSPTAK